MSCVNDGETFATDRRGNPILNTQKNSPYLTKYGFTEFANGGPYSVLNITATTSNSYGTSAQLTSTRQLFGHDNHFVMGFGYDGGSSDFSAETFLGGFTVARGYIPSPNIELDLADGSIEPVSVHTSNDYYGVFAVDTFDITDKFFGTVSGRFQRCANRPARSARHGVERQSQFQPLQPRRRG